MSKPTPKKPSLYDNLSEKEKIDILIDQGVWKKEQEEEIEILSINIANQYQTKTKLIVHL